MTTRKAVKMPVSNWRVVQGILLREALRLDGEGATKDVAEIMDLVVPAIEEATDSETLVGLRRAVRNSLGMPALQ